MDVKKPTTYAQQLEILKKRGCVIENETWALEVLKNINYYRLSAYFIPFKKDENTYFEGTTFENVYHIYEFDRKLRSLIFSMLEEIEILLRTRISYFFSHKYGALGYKDTDNFNLNHDNEKFNKHYSDMIEQNKTKAFVKHHIEEYGSQFPLWVLVELMSLGELSFFYSDMLIADRKAIANDVFGTQEKNVCSWLACLTNLRNSCAHYSRLYNAVFPFRPRTPNGYGYTLQKRVFDYLIVVKFMYLDADKWNNTYVTAIKQLINEYDGYLDLNHLGFLDSWEDMLRK